MNWGDCLTGQNKDVATLACVPIIFQNVIRATLIFAGVIAVFFIVFSGIKLITSGGDPKQVEGARKTLMWAVIGLIIVLISFFIVNFIAQVTGAHCITTFGFGNCQ